MTQRERQRPTVPVPHRILVIRLDRLGDVILSTPVLQVLRQSYPHAVIAMMVRTACREVVEGNPYVDEIILYEKEGAHRRMIDTVRFAWRIRRHRFDTALVLHPTRRAHWIARLAGIPVRIGYQRRSGWLLTHPLPDRKHEGAKHEAAYTLELLHPLGLEPSLVLPAVAVKAETAKGIRTLLASRGVASTERLVAIHPSASCRSKRWQPDRFAAVADRLIDEWQASVVLVAGPDDCASADAVQAAMRRPVINLGGMLSIGQLTAVLQSCQVLVSNDSGPVHLAAAVGTPVVAIFGRNQRGLSQARWGPLGPGHIVLQKDVGCVTCLAHNCAIDFKCLAALGTDEVFHAAALVLKRRPNTAQISSG